MNADWDDLYERLQKAEQELEQMADETRDVYEAQRLLNKASGVALAIDYMRGYYDPASAQAATPTIPDGYPTDGPSAPRGGISYEAPTNAQHDFPYSIFKYVIDPFSETSMIKGAKPLYVGEQGTDVCVWALVDVTVEEKEHRAINAYGTGHSLPAHPGRYLGSVQMQNGENAGLVFHIFDGDDI